MNINQLDDDCLLLIFERVPLKQVLYNVASVCTRWKVLKRKMCSQRRSLTILIGTNALRLVAQSQFAIPFIDKVAPNNSSTPIYNPITHLGPELARIEYKTLDNKIGQLIDAFPHITSLTVVLSDFEGTSYADLIHVLESWRPTLECLRLWHGKRRESLPDPMFELIPLVICTELMATINSLYALKSLLIESPDILYHTVEMTVMGQLEQLYYSQNIPINEKGLMSWLRPYVVSSGKLKQIGLGGSMIASTEDFDQFFNYSREFHSKFTHIPICFSLTYNQLSRFCDTFPQLCSVSLPIRQLSISELAQCLSRLSQLIHLNLYIDTNTVNSNQIAPKWLQTPSNQSIDSLSVKVLTVELNAHDHNDLTYLRPSLLFPCVQYVQIKQVTYNRCVQCEVLFRSPQGIETQQPNRSEITRSCIEKIVEPFKLCNQLSSPQIVVLNQDGVKMFENNRFSTEQWADEQQRYYLANHPLPQAIIIGAARQEPLNWRKIIIIILVVCKIIFWIVYACFKIFG